MTFHSKKLLTIVTESVLEGQLVEDIRRLGAHGYTVCDARGGGTHGVQGGAWSFDANIRIDVVCDEAVAGAIAERCRSRYLPHYGMIVYVSEVGVLRPEKF
ncbi:MULTISPECIES: P-II family nitrogen regulator [Gulbenkiania]|uniref:Nitrogen regulatory protein P-II family n=2 Tax=Gulbenkiania TaxID=397456 RepID=A0A0K6GY59_9NEIS|nr:MULTISPECIES: hypothetical protein [Gulbenkiania]TCW32793.1 hypothetical protein EV669_10292 [Gulbenkiania mobilis]CUA83656.1 hypothetical protein Ga0061063_1852 [Gulbenkiania indica]